LSNGSDLVDDDGFHGFAVMKVMEVMKVMGARASGRGPRTADLRLLLARSGPEHSGQTDHFRESECVGCSPLTSRFAIDTFGGRHD
jgi:hypothetical protein